MKKWIFLFVSVLALAACNQNSGSNNNTAQTPLNCINGQTYCDNTAYNNIYGYSAYPGMYNGYNYTNQFNTSGFCNCPAGTVPTLSQIGLGCVRYELVRPFSGFAFSWQFGGNYVSGYNPISIPQISNMNGYSSPYSSCQSQVYQSCLLGQPNSCSNGTLCRPTGYNSTMGICSI